MTMFLKQSTAVTLKIGPFVDATDGASVEAGLTLSQADIRLSKNGGNIAQKNESTSCTYDEVGMYDCPIDTTDSNTLGRLQLIVTEAGALPVFHDYMVLTGQVWDSLFGADVLQVDLTQIAGATVSTTTAQLGVNMVSGSAGAITATVIADNAIDAGAIAADAITAAKIADNAITDAKVAADVTIASVTGAVGSVATGGITAASLAADAITAATIADGAIDAATFAAGAIDASAIAANAITDAKVASDVTIASVTGAVGSVTGNVGGNVVGSVGSVASGGIAAASLAAAACAKIADTVLRRTFANAHGSSDGDTVSFRSLLGAVAKLVNRISTTVNAGKVTIFHEDDATEIGTQTLTTDSGAAPIVEANTDG